MKVANKKRFIFFLIALFYLIFFLSGFFYDLFSNFTTNDSPAPLPPQRQKVIEKEIDIIKYSRLVTSTAYNSTVEQCDANPWITASGTHCQWGTVACNFLPFGTKIKIDGFGDKIFVVEDRMARRFSNRVDIWFPKYSQAIQHGKRVLKIYILEGKA